MATTAGEMREMLISAIEDVKAGRLDQARAGAIAKLASAVTQSMQLEIDARRFAIGLDKDGKKMSDMGPLVLGDERGERPAAPSKSIVHRISDEEPVEE